jgi:hypothetical protein
VSPDVTQDVALRSALADANIARHVTGDVRKVIFVPGRLLNLVV